MKFDFSPQTFFPQNGALTSDIVAPNPHDLFKVRLTDQPTLCTDIPHLPQVRKYPSLTSVSFHRPRLQFTGVRQLKRDCPRSRTTAPWPPYVHHPTRTHQFGISIHLHDRCTCRVHHKITYPRSLGKTGVLGCERPARETFQSTCVETQFFFSNLWNKVTWFCTKIWYLAPEEKILILEKLFSQNIFREFVAEPLDALEFDLTKTKTKCHELFFFFCV